MRMVTVYKKTFTKPLPANAEVFTRKGEKMARWKTARGKAKTASVTTTADGVLRIALKAAIFTAKYRDGQGIVREVATGCRGTGSPGGADLHPGWIEDPL